MIMNQFMQKHFVLTNFYVTLILASWHTDYSLSASGYAYEGAACEQKSVSLVMDIGFNTATTIAHELGHR